MYKDYNYNDYNNNNSYGGQGYQERKHNQNHSSSELFSSTKVLSEAAQSVYNHEPGKVNKAKVAVAASNILGATGVLDESKGFGKYVDKTADYLSKHDSSSGITTRGKTGHFGGGYGGSGGYGYKDNQYSETGYQGGRSSGYDDRYGGNNTDSGYGGGRSSGGTVGGYGRGYDENGYGRYVGVYDNKGRSSGGYVEENRSGGGYGYERSRSDYGNEREQRYGGGYRDDLDSRYSGGYGYGY